MGADALGEDALEESEMGRGAAEGRRGKRSLGREEKEMGRRGRRAVSRVGTARERARLTCLRSARDAGGCADGLVGATRTPVTAGESPCRIVRAPSSVAASAAAAGCEATCRWRRASLSTHVRVLAG